MPQLEVDGATLTYDDEGPRDVEGVPLVFVHGWTANRRRWDHQVAHFAEALPMNRLMAAETSTNATISGMVPSPDAFRASAPWIAKMRPRFVHPKKATNCAAKNTRTR